MKEFRYTETEFVGISNSSSRYCDIVLYTGEIPGYSYKPDCFQFDTVKLAGEWLVREEITKSIQSAITGIYHVLDGTWEHYRGFTASCAVD